MFFLSPWNTPFEVFGVGSEASNPMSIEMLWTLRSIKKTESNNRTMSEFVTRPFSFNRKVFFTTPTAIPLDISNKCFVFGTPLSTPMFNSQPAVSAPFLNSNHIFQK